MMLDALRGQPVETLLAGGLLVAGTVLGGFALRSVTRRTQSLHHLVLLITLTSLSIGAVVAILLARLMVLDAQAARNSIAVIAVAAVFAVALTLIASAPLARDAARLETAVRRIEGGDRSGRTGVHRADELGHVARALDELTERLATLERERAAVEAERRTMLTSIGHDLRTPLAALRAAVEALADGIAPDPPRYLAAMDRDVAALSALVEDLFLLARIESGTLESGPTRVDLVEVAGDAVDALEPAAAARRVTLTLRTDGAVAVRGNATALGRVIRNLLDNAIRHTPEGSIVDVEVAAGDTDAVVRVVDQGTGFAETFAPLAFDRFTRPDPARTRGDNSGSGLGLAIARGIVEAHGGSIRIEPAPGGRVAFALPVAV